MAYIQWRRGDGLGHGAPAIMPASPASVPTGVANLTIGTGLAIDYNKNAAVENREIFTPLKSLASWQRAWLSATLIFLTFLSPTCRQDASAQSSTQPDNQSTQSTQSVQSEPVQLFLPPVLEKGSQAWGTAFLPDGQGLAKQAILINGKSVQTDDYGLFSFTAPDTAFSVVVKDENKIVWETSYGLSNRGLLVSDKAALASVDRLDELEDEFNTQPLIMHAPAALELQQAFVVIGKNFSGKFGHDQVNIDGFECDSFAGSKRSLVVSTRNRSPVGPVKEINVICDEQSSLPLEVDLTRVEFRGESKTTNGNALDLELIGSNLPSLIALSSKSSEIQLKFGGKRLGAQSIFLSPGGQQNRITVGIDNKKLSELSGHLIPNNLFDPYTQKASSELLGRKPLLAVNKAEVVRLKKRLLALEERIALLSKQRAEHVKQKDFSIEDDAKLESSIKSAAIRMSRLSRSLRSRRAILDADGMSENEWAQLNDSAADNMSRSLDLLIAKNEFGFTESRLLRSSASKKPKLEQDHYAQLAITGAQSRSPLSLTVNARSRRWKAPVSSAGGGPGLVAPPAPYRFDPADLAPYFSDELPVPVRPITNANKKSRNRKGYSQSRAAAAPGKNKNAARARANPGSKNPSATKQKSPTKRK